MEYQTIYMIKESEKATVELAILENHEGPVIIKKLQGTSPDIYRLLCCAQNSHIPEVYAYEQQGDELIVAEEYVDGENLEEYLKNFRLSDKEKLHLALQLCEAVKVLHSMEPPIIHRDIKPSNILITGRGILKLIDFDASRQYKEENEGDTRLLGTAGYAPPEQFGYSQTDIRSDIYSLGVVFHEMYLSENSFLAGHWEKISERCTCFDPKNRFQNVEELEKEIRELLSGKRALRKGLKTVGILSLLGLCGVGLMLAAKYNQREAALSPDNVATTSPTQAIIEGKLVGVLNNTSDEFYSEYPQDILVTLRSEASCKINGLYFRFAEPMDWADYAEMERLQSWCYDIVEDGKGLVIKKEYLRELYSDSGTVSLAISCDDGTLQEFSVKLLDGIPEGVAGPLLVEESQSTATPIPTTMLYPEIDKVPSRIGHSYYQSYRTDFLVPEKCYTEYELLDEVSCYCYQTGKTITIPKEMLELCDGYIRISEQFMMSLEPYVYRFSFHYRRFFGGSSVSERNIKVYPAETEVAATSSKLIKGGQTVYSEYPDVVSNMIKNGESRRIAGAYLLNSNEEQEPFWPGRCEIIESGRVITVPGNELLPYINQESVILWIMFDDGTTEEMQITLKEGFPETLMYTTGYENVLRSTSPYYLPFAEQLGWMFGHNCSNQELVSAHCYNYSSQEIQQIPLDMIEFGTGYVCVKKEYMKTLEPLIYKFFFELNQGFRMECNVRVYPEAPEPVDGSMEHYFSLLTEEYYPHMPGVGGILNDGMPGNITDVFLKQPNGTETALKPDWYEISCEGRFVLVKREFFQQYSVEEVVTLVFRFDDGDSEQREVTIME